MLFLQVSQVFSWYLNLPSPPGEEYDPNLLFEYLCFCLSIGPVVYFLQQIDKALSRASPFAAVGVVVGTVYWSAVTYGAVTVMQVQ